MQIRYLKLTPFLHAITCICHNSRSSLFCTDLTSFYLYGKWILNQNSVNNLDLVIARGTLRSSNCAYRITGIMPHCQFSSELLDLRDDDLATLYRTDFRFLRSKMNRDGVSCIHLWQHLETINVINEISKLHLCIRRYLVNRVQH